MQRMNQDNLAMIKASWRQLYPHDKGRGNNAGIICPICGSGSGPHGSGIKLNPKSGKNYGLKCFNPKCTFSGGDVIDLKAQELGVDTIEAYKILCDALNLDSCLDDEWTPTPSKTTAKPKTAPKPPEPAEPAPELVNYLDYYEKTAAALVESTEAQSYLQARGISLETAKSQHIGFDAAWISPTACRRLEAEGKSWRPNPKPVIIMPVNSHYYIARDIRREENIPEAEKAYKKSNETGNGSIGIWRLVKALKSPEEAVFITEGIFDALSIIEAGAEAAALNSTSNIDKFKERLATILDKNPEARKKKFLLCMDNDEAGKAATEKLAGILQSQGISYMEADILAGQNDANEALVYDKKHFCNLVRIALEQAKEITSPEPIEEEPADGPGANVLTFLDKVQTEAYKPYKTELPFFDDLLGGGVLRQSLILLLAAPGTGKTTLCQQLAEAMARNKKQVIYLNLEMSQEQMLAKAFSMHLAEEGHTATADNILQGYKWTDSQRKTVLEYAEKYQREISPYLQYNPAGIGADISKIMEYLTNIGEAALAGKKEAPVVILDYLHLVTSQRAMDTQELIKQTVAGLKEYAIKFNTISIAISATNREANKAGRISASSARDSSALEYTADTILTLNYEALDQRRELEGMKADAENPEYMAILQHQQPRQMIIRVLKARLGLPGASVLVDYDAAHNIFREQSLKGKGFININGVELQRVEDVFG